MTLPDLARLALEVLRAQRTYSESRSTSDLAASKALEAELKRAAEDALAGPSLFDGEARIEPAGVRRALGVVTRYALGRLDDRGVAWFIRRDAFVGNLMLTTSPDSAWTWPSTGEAGRWLVALPEWSRDQVRGRELVAFPIAFTTGEPERSLALVRLDTKAAPAEGTPKQDLLSESPVNKVEYVKTQGQTREHHCHWPGCDKQVPPAMWGCKEHWFKLPKSLRDRIWAAYRPGQEIDMSPSREYLAVAREAREWIGRNAEPPAKRAPEPTPFSEV